jgi:hypothetical protein
MPPQSVIALTQTAFALILVFWVDSFVSLRRIVARLKSDHRGLWERLGSPEAFTSMMSSRGDFYANILGRTSLTLWLSRGDYLEVNDPTITKLARRRKFSKGAVIVVVVSFLLAYAWLRRYD